MTPVGATSTDACVASWNQDAVLVHLIPPGSSQAQSNPTPSDYDDSMAPFREYEQSEVPNGMIDYFPDGHGGTP
jgi:hypothetical protein